MWQILFAVYHLSDDFKWNQLDELYQWFTDTYGFVVELKMNLKSVWIHNSICSFFT